MLIVENFPQSKLQENLSEFSLRAKNYRLNKAIACQRFNFLVNFPQRKPKIFFEPYSGLNFILKFHLVAYKK